MNLKFASPVRFSRQCGLSSLLLSYCFLFGGTVPRCFWGLWVWKRARCGEALCENDFLHAGRVHRRVEVTREGGIEFANTHSHLHVQPEILLGELVQRAEGVADVCSLVDGEEHNV